MKNKFELIAETAFSHEGDFEYLVKQVDAAKAGKADFVKFQVFLDKDAYCVENHPAYNILDKWMLSKEKWLDIFNFAKSLGLKIVVLPLNNPSLEFCKTYDHLIDAYEIHSVCFNEVLLLNELKNNSKTIILGIGGRLPHEINFAEKLLEADKDRLVLMYGFQSFPTDSAQLNLSKVKKFSELFNCKVGYADHTHYESDLFIQLNTAAYILGARFFEKHIVLEKGTKRIDYESGISSNDFIRLRAEIDKITTILGDGDIFTLNEKELVYKNREKKIVFTRDIPQNSIIKMKDLTYKISEEHSDFEQKDLNKLLGKKTHIDCKNNETIKFELLKHD